MLRTQIVSRPLLDKKGEGLSASEIAEGGEEAGQLAVLPWGCRSPMRHLVNWILHVRLRDLSAALTGKEN
jgi:hypothetical protein